MTADVILDEVVDMLNRWEMPTAFPTLGFVYSDGKKCYVLTHEKALKKEEFIPPGSVHTATVALDVILERILNKAEVLEELIDEMRGNK